MISWLRVFVVLLAVALILSLYFLFSQVRRLGNEIKMHQQPTSQIREERTLFRV